MEIECVKTLNAPDYANFRKHIVDEPARGTPEWFLEEEAFRAWLLKEEFSVVWIRGSPGQGKTVLSKFLLQHLGGLLRMPGNATAIYFFFHNQDDRFRSVNSILRSLIKQLLITPNIFRHFPITFKEDISWTVRSDYVLWKIFDAMVHDLVFGTIYCVIDAMDECEDMSPSIPRSWLLHRLVQTAAQLSRNNTCLKLLVTDRPVMDIIGELGKHPCIDLKANTSDLRIFINNKVSALQHLSPELQIKAVELLLEGAGRTFLWASIVLKKLEKMTLPSAAKLKDAVERSPTDLDDLYHSIIDQIMNGSEEEQKLLVWVVYSRRPITLRELEAAIATQMDSKNKKSTNKHMVNLTIGAVTSAAGVILEITDDKVHLIHQSAKEFLLRNPRLHYTTFCDGLNPNIYLAKVCMVYLNFDNFRRGPCGNQQDLACQESEYPLFRYAAHYWHTHIQSKGEAENVRSFLQKLVEPHNPILLSWGEAVSIEDLDTANDAMEIAARANIVWLAECESSGTVITEQIVMEATRDWAKGHKILETLVSQGSSRFTEDATQAIARNFNERIMRLLLEENRDIEIAETIAMSAAANQQSGNYVMELLLEKSNELVFTTKILETAAKNRVSGMKVIELLLDAENTRITEEAATAILRKYDAKVMKLLVRREDITVTGPLLETATQNRNYDKEVMHLLFSRGGKIQITEEVVEAAASKKGIGKELMQLILSKGSEMQIAEVAIRAIVARFDSEVLQQLLDRDKEIQITEGVLMEAAVNWKSGNEMMRLLLSRNGEVQITENVIKAVAARFDSEIMQLLLKRNGKSQISDEIVIAAAGNKDSGKAVMQLLLRQGGKMQITEGVIKTIAASFDLEVLQSLLDRDGEIRITEETATAAAENIQDGEEVTQLLLSRGGEIQITEGVVIAAAGNRGCGNEVMRLLLGRDGEIQITEGVVIAAAGNQGCGNEVMRLLLSRDGGIQITEGAIKVVAAEFDSEMMQLLINRGGKIQTAEGVIIEAAGNEKSGEKTMQLLIGLDVEIQITEEVIKAAAGNVLSGKELVQLLMNRDGRIRITEEVVKAAMGNPWSGRAVMRLLLSQDGEIQITKEAIKLVQSSFDSEVTQLLKTN